MAKFAIVGMSCLFPGASSPDDYWTNLVEGVDSRTDGTPEIFGAAGAPAPEPAGEHRIYCTRGGFVRGFTFDPDGYRLPADYLRRLDRVFHWSLHVAREALTDAASGTTAGSRVGVVLGNYPFPTAGSTRSAGRPWWRAAATGLDSAGFADAPGPASEEPPGADALAEAHDNWPGGMPARVVGAALGLNGPALALDAACSSALYAVKLACDHLAAGRADLMLAGGVCAPDPMLIHLSFADLHAYPEDGFSQPFHARSGGILTGQGAGMVAVKRLDDALRDGDRVYAVIDAIALTNDGAGRHLLVPNVRGQLDAYARAYAEAGITPADVQYLECHATGTPLGDSTELAGIRQFFGEHGGLPYFGSVKANIGHLLTVAGLSSMIKVILALRHGTIPPTIGVDEPLDGDATAGRLVRAAMPWPATDGPRRAAVSAFGFGGTNAHIVLSQPPSGTGAPAAAQSAPSTPTRLAITGLGGHLGPFAGRDAFERAVHDGRDGFAGLPERRWRGFTAGDVGVAAPEGGYLDGFDFDALRYRIPPRDLDHFNQQQLLLLGAADEALRDAGYAPPSSQQRGGAGRRVAVVVAMEMEPSAHGHGVRYALGTRLRAECARRDLDGDADAVADLVRAARNGIHDGIEPTEVLSYIGNIVASRISSTWHLTGPSFAVCGDSASGIAALDVAELLLRDDTVEAVLVGAVDLAGGPENQAARARLAAAAGIRGLALADEPGEGGWRVGEGAVALLVTRAPATGRVYASIDALALHQSGTVVPAADPEAITAVARQALDAAGAVPEQVELLELHAAGIAEQDRAELQALAGIWSTPRVGRAATALGAVAATVGDAQVAGPLAAVAKAALCLHHGYLPAVPGWTGPAGQYRELLDSAGFYLPTQSRPWLRRRRDEPRRAAVSVLGTGGTYAHLVLSGSEPHGTYVRTDWNRGGGPLILPVQAADPASLLSAVEAVRVAVADGADLGSLCRDGAAALRPDGLRVVFCATDREGLLRECDSALAQLPTATGEQRDWATPAGSYFTARPIGAEGKVALVYPGAFNTYLGMGSELFRTFPSLLPWFEEQAERPADVLRSPMLYPRSVTAPQRRDLMLAEARLLEDIPFMLATGTSFALLHTEALRGPLGLRVHGGLGYSLGESSMMFALGGWQQGARNDTKIAATPLFRDRLCGPKRTVRELWGIGDDVPDAQVWSTLVLLADAAAVRQALPRFDRVFLTHVNTPQEVVIAGDPKQCAELVRELGCRSARAPANHVMHCPVVDGDVAELADLNRYPTRPVTDLDLFSAYDYDRITRFEQDRVAANIAQTLRSTVDFPRLVRAAYDRGYRYFIEVGPGGTCSRWIRETLGADAHMCEPVARRGAPDATGFARVVARLVSHGVPVNLDALVPAEAAPAGRRVTCGGEPVAELVARAAAPIVSRLRPRPGTPAAAPAAESPELVLPPAPSLAAPAAAVPPAVPRSTPPVDSRPAPTHRSETDLPMNTDPAPAITFAGEPVGLVPYPVAAQQTTTPLPVTAAAPAAAVPAPVPPVVAATASPADASLSDLVSVLRQQSVATHRSVLAAQRQLQEQVVGLLRGGTGTATVDAPARPGPSATAVAPAGPAPAEPAASQPQAPKPRAPKPPGVIFDAADLLEFATGRVANVFGEQFAPVDQAGRRVRLPAPPYHFVSRVTALDAEPLKFEPSFIRTEYDVPVGAWYTVDGQVPPAVTIEAGQCDMLLAAYLGIDFENRGERIYRLLDSALVWHGNLPREGQRLRYDIWIDRWVKTAGPTLFFFRYQCFADDELILELKNACAGFFTDAELAVSQGVNLAELARRQRQYPRDGQFKPLARTGRTSLGGDDITRLGRGEIAAVFGPAFEQGGLNPSLRLPTGDLLMVDEVTRLDRIGGRAGLGAVSAVKRLVPDGWYFTSHFPDDPVLAGSLVAEGAVQLLQTYALSVGLHLCLPDTRFQPVPGLETEVKVRGQITPEHRELRYEVDIVDIGLLERPYLVADVLVYLGDKPVISITNLGIRIEEKPGAPYRPEDGGIVPADLGRRNAAGEPAMLSEFHMAHAAKGDLATAMGTEFEIYRRTRAPYIPNGDFLYVDRVMGLTGTRGQLKPGAVMVTEYDSPPEAWYYAENGDTFMPNFVYMESSLQAAILLGYYLGATLPHPDREYSIRNLDGKATLVRPIDMRGKTIRQTSTLLSSQAVPGAILQRFRYELAADGEVFYTGESLFGYFSEQALANQVGLDSGRYVAPWLEQQQLPPGTVRSVDLTAVRGRPGGPRMPQHRLALLDWLDVVPDGGAHGKGYLRAHRKIRPEDWYFERHFYRDPVMPGSLGVEAILEALRAYVLELGLADGISNPVFALPAGVELGWKYRGQILRGDREMDVELHVKEVRRDAGRLLVIGDASLWKPGLRIYELENVAVEVRPGGDAA